MNILFISINKFCQPFEFFHIHVLQKKIMTSAYHKSYQQTFSFNLVEIDCLTTAPSYINIGLVFLELLRGQESN